MRTASLYHRSVGSGTPAEERGQPGKTSHTRGSLT